MIKPPSTKRRANAHLMATSPDSLTPSPPNIYFLDTTARKRQHSTTTISPNFYTTQTFLHNTSTLKTYLESIAWRTVAYNRA